MGLDWCLKGDAAGAIGCKRFSRRDAQCVSVLKDARADFDWKAEAANLPQFRAAISNMMGFLGPHARAVNGLNIASLAMSVEVDEVLAPSFMDQFSGVLHEDMVERAVEWIYAAMCNKARFSKSYPHQLSHLYHHVPVEFQIWRMDWNRGYVLETAAITPPGGCSGWLAGPLSFRGKMLQYVGLDDDLSELIFQDHEVDGMHDLADQLEHFGRSVLRPSIKEESEEEDQDDDLYPPSEALEIVESAVAWLRFWADRGLEMYAWY